MTEKGATINVLGIHNYDPLVAIVKVEQGILERGHYIPTLGIVSAIEERDTNKDVECTIEDPKKAYCIACHVTQESFALLETDVMKNLLAATEKKVAKWKEWYEKALRKGSALTFEEIYGKEIDKFLLSKEETIRQMEELKKNRQEQPLRELESPSSSSGWRIS